MSTYFGSSSISRAWRPVFSQRDQGRARAAERVEHDVPALARVADRPLDQRHRLHGRVQVVPDRLVEEPDIALVPGAAPVVVAALLPAVQDRLVLALVVGAAEGEGVLGPDDERRPLAAGGCERLLQRVQLGRAHAQVHGALGDAEDVDAGVVQERLEAGAEIVVQDRPVLAAELVLRRVGVVDVVRAVGRSTCRRAGRRAPARRRPARWRRRTAGGGCPGPRGRPAC